MYQLDAGTDWHIYGRVTTYQLQLVSTVVVWMIQHCNLMSG